MKIIIAAGTGFLGRNLENYFLDKNYEVKILTRNPKRKNEIFWDAKTIGIWKDDLEHADVLINLAGKSVDCRYNDKNRKEIYNSRIDSTRVLQKAIDKCQNLPKSGLMQVLQLFMFTQRRISIQKKTESSVTISQ
jgi:NAD dependent epimerase/dehydratase family enzyme